MLSIIENCQHNLSCKFELIVRNLLVHVSRHTAVHCSGGFVEAIFKSFCQLILEIDTSKIFLKINKVHNSDPIWISMKSESIKYQESCILNRVVNHDFVTNVWKWQSTNRIHKIHQLISIYSALWYTYLWLWGEYMNKPMYKCSLCICLVTDKNAWKTFFWGDNH